jgi:hypothetical protein
MATVTTDMAATTVEAVTAEATAGTEMSEGTASSAAGLVDLLTADTAADLQAAFAGAVTSTEAAEDSTAEAGFTAVEVGDFTAVAGTAAAIGN